nr:hypothetical protein [Duganella aceris]
MALIVWRADHRLATPHATQRQAVTYILAPLMPTLERRRTAQAPVRPSRHIAPAPITAPQPAVAVPAQPPQAITLSTPPAADPFAQPPPKAAEDLLQRSLKSAALADRQMRKEAWNPRDKKIANDSTALAARLGGAYVGGDGGLSQEATTLDDGRVSSKIHAGGSTYCAVKESNGMTGGRDPFRDGIKTKVTTCPR